MRRVVLPVIVALTAACPPGLDAKTVSCVPDGSTSTCFEWAGADLPALGAVELSCAQLGASPVAGTCPAELRTIGCQIVRGAVTETRWYRTPGFEVLSLCPDAGRTVVTPQADDAGSMEPLDAGPRCSTPAVDSAVVAFSNAGASPVFLRWVTQSCTEVGYPTLMPGAVVNQPTFIGHVWRLRRDAADGPVIREYVVTAPSASVVVR